jgi:hypothetical protein
MKKKLTSEEALEKIKEAVKTGKFEHAPQDRVDALEPYIEKVLEALGHPEAFVTDESHISDFKDHFAPKEEQETWLPNLSEKLGLSIGLRDPIVDVALQLKRKGET